MNQIMASMRKEFHLVPKNEERGANTESASIKEKIPKYELHIKAIISTEEEEEEKIGASSNKGSRCSHESRTESSKGQRKSTVYQRKKNEEGPFRRFSQKQRQRFSAAKEKICIKNQQEEIDEWASIYRDRMRKAMKEVKSKLSATYGFYSDPLLPPRINAFNVC